MDKASAFGAGDSRFESWAGQKLVAEMIWMLLCASSTFPSPQVVSASGLVAMQCCALYPLRNENQAQLFECQDILGDERYNTLNSEDASAGNRARVTSMATIYSATRPLILLRHIALHPEIQIEPL